MEVVTVTNKDSRHTFFERSPRLNAKCFSGLFSVFSPIARVCQTGCGSKSLSSSIVRLFGLTGPLFALSFSMSCTSIQRIEDAGLCFEGAVYNIFLNG